MRALVISRINPASAASEAVSWFALFSVSKNHRRRHFSGLCHESKVAQRPRFRGTGWPQIRPPRPSEAEVLPEGLDVLLGVLCGHVDGVWRAYRRRPRSSCRRQRIASITYLKSTYFFDFGVFQKFVWRFFKYATDPHSVEDQMQIVVQVLGPRSFWSFFGSKQNCTSNIIATCCHLELNDFFLTNQVSSFLFRLVLTIEACTLLQLSAAAG